MRLAWLTDIHLNFLRPSALDTFCDEIAALSPDALLVTGDISEAPSLGAHLAALDARLGRPIYFVLGNHDYYRGTVAGVREEVRRACAESRWLRWLSEAPPIALAPGVALIGHDGWADGRAGDYAGSQVVLNDYLLIEDLALAGRHERLAVMTTLARGAARHLRDEGERALVGAAHVIVATHVPPFREACWHEGAISNDHWQPHFTSVVVGETLASLMAAHPDRTMTVFCGHTHSPGFARLAPNLGVYTGGAHYGRPIVQRIVEL